MFFALFLITLQGEEAMSFYVKSKAFHENGVIPSQYTCDGRNISPPLAWSGLPEGTESLALIVDDPDAPAKTWVHWVVYNIPPTIKESPEGTVPESSLQGINDYKRAAYNGPCPPSGTHRYFFKLYALDILLPLPKGATKEELEAAMQEHILAEAHLVGTYTKT